MNSPITRYTCLSSRNSPTDHPPFAGSLLPFWRETAPAAIPTITGGRGHGRRKERRTIAEETHRTPRKTWHGTRVITKQSTGRREKNRHEAARFFTNSQKQGRPGPAPKSRKKTAALFRSGCRFGTTSILLGEWFTNAPAA
ncbi:hypothetical protein M493_14390 [Geobacillus genomosp. 3]|uniref:Uncharacterized protein n=1 Tax=Geobacillus genomosp. 3 TaxID=1921421 RepID=S5Z8F0_GEOG3|nr:hypothetical protein M493_14390 [Geobacillus genomosp. 3]